MKIGAACLVINDAIIKTLAASIPLTQIIAIRAATITLICLLLLVMAGRKPNFTFSRDVLIRTGFTVGNVFAFVAAISALPFSVAVLVDYTNILFVAIGAPFVLGERLTGLRLAAVLIGLTGAALILLPQVPVVGAAILLPVLSGFLGAGRELWTRRLRGGGAGSVELTLFAAIGMAVIALIVGFTSWQMPRYDMLVLVILAGCLQGLALILMAQALYSGEAVSVAPFRLTALIWALLLAYFFFGDQTTWLQGVGIITVFLALILITLQSRPNRSTKV